MKRTTTAMGLTALLLLAGLFLWRGSSTAAPHTEEKKEPRTISTSGSATIQVAPDSARVFFGVQTIAPTIKAARTDNAAKVKKVMDALNALKIADLKMKSSDVQVEMLYSHPQGNQLPQVTGFRITHTFTVLVQNSDVEKLSKTASAVLDTALENGVTMVQQITFFKKDLTDIRRQAMEKAVREAVANAQALVSGVSGSLTGTIAISGAPEYAYRGQQFDNVQSAAITDTPLVAGNLNVTCNVNVTCTY